MPAKDNISALKISLICGLPAILVLTAAASLPLFWSPPKLTLEGSGRQQSADLCRALNNMGVERWKAACLVASGAGGKSVDEAENSCYSPTFEQACMDGLVPERNP
jgi:hypothetical protein